jgi:hypothetical protein
MLIAYQIIRTDGDVTHHEVEWPEKFGYKELRALLAPIFHAQRGGDDTVRFEHVAVLGDDNLAADLFVDEFGAGVYGYGALPVNLAATRIYHRASIRRGEAHRDGIIADAPLIYGDAVYFPINAVWR